MSLHHHSICEENKELGSGQEGVLTISCEVPYFLELAQLQIRQLKEVNSDVASDLVVDLTSLPETLQILLLVYWTAGKVVENELVEIH